VCASLRTFLVTKVVILLFVKMSFSCLRCCCKGEVNPRTCTITSPQCECICCSISLAGSSCVYTNINKCKLCKKPYTFQKLGSTYAYLCDSNCELFRQIKQTSEPQNTKSSAKSSTSSTSLVRAISSGDVNLTWLLLQGGANPFETDAFGNSALSLLHTLEEAPTHVSAVSREHLQKLSDMLPRGGRRATAEDSDELPPPHMYRSQSEQTPSPPRPPERTDKHPSTRDEEDRHTDSPSDQDQEQEQNTLPPLPPPLCRSISLDTGRQTGQTLLAQHSGGSRGGHDHSSSTGTGRCFATGRRMRQQIPTFRQVLVDGKQVFTPLTLEKIGSDPIASPDATTSADAGADADVESNILSDAVQKWTLTEMSNMIVKQTEIIHSYRNFTSSSSVNNTPLPSPCKKQTPTHEEAVNPKTDKDTDTDTKTDTKTDTDMAADITSETTQGAEDLVLPPRECSACLDPLPYTSLAFSCSHLGCPGCLCRDCLFRSVFVTITSALYAVPVIRCPG
jgi:hypothetical protein